MIDAVFKSVASLDGPVPFLAGTFADHQQPIDIILNELLMQIPY